MDGNVQHIMGVDGRGGRQPICWRNQQESVEDRFTNKQEVFILEKDREVRRGVGLCTYRN